MSGSVLVCPKCKAKLRLKGVPKGRSITCPRCSNAIPVPASEADEHLDDEFDEAPTPPRRSRSAVSSRSAGSPRSKVGKGARKKKSESNPTMLIVGGLGAAVVVIGLIVMFVMKSGSRDPVPQMASNSPTNTVAPAAGAPMAHGVPASGVGMPGGGALPHPAGAVSVPTASPVTPASASEGTPMPSAPVIASASTPPAEPEPMASNPEDAYLDLDDEDGPDVHEINGRAVRAKLGSDAPPKIAVAGAMDYTAADDPISIEIMMYGQKIQQAVAAGHVKLTKVVDDQGRPLRPAKAEKHEDPLVSMLPLGRLNRQWQDKPADLRLKFVRNPGMKAIGTLEATLVARVPVSKMPLTIKNVAGLVGKPVPDLKPYITKVTRLQLLKDVIVFEFEVPSPYMLCTAGFDNGDIKGPVFMASMESGGHISHAVTFYQVAVPPTFDVACQVGDKFEEQKISFTLENVPLQN